MPFAHPRGNTAIRGNDDSMPLAARFSGKIVTYGEALRYSMDDALESNPFAVIFGQGVDDHKGIFGTTSDLHKKYGMERVFDTPLAEEGVTGVAIGAALGGVYPITTHIRVDFSLLAMNQIINLAAKYKYMSGGKLQVPMLIRMIIGRSWGQGAQHSQSLQSLFSHIPGLTVVMPSSSAAILEMYPYFVQNYPGPVVSIEHRLLYDIKFKIPTELSRNSPLASKKLREGSDVTIVATSIMVVEALRAAEHLSHSHISCEVIDLNCLSHPDTELIISSVKKTGRLIVADTSWQAYGVGAEVSRLIAENAAQSLKANVITLGMKPAPCPTAKSLEDLYYPNGKTLVDAVARMVKGTAQHGVPLPDDKTTVETYRTFKGPF